MWYVVLLVVGTVGAVALARLFHLGAAATLAALLPTLAPAYLAWQSFQQDRYGTAQDLAAAADQLASAVKGQWEAEAAIRRLNDPYPLPVAWRQADPDLVEPWPELAGLAHSWPGGPPGDPGRWPADETGLAGSGAEIGEVFSVRVPTGRLVVLGEPGSGKTMLLVRLLQDLISRRAPGGPVPVLFSLASWDPVRRPLQDWLAGQLRCTYPALRMPAPATVEVDRGRRAPVPDLARALLDARLILPVLDGFDEIQSKLHPVALDAVNRALPARQPLVLAGRTAAYRAALARSGSTVGLNGAAGIQLLPLTTAEITRYLVRVAGGPRSRAAERWTAVTACLGADNPLSEALSTPLGLFLARTIYGPGTGTATADSEVPRHPDELCAIPTREALDAHLFDAFIPAAYTGQHPVRPRWALPQAHRSLVFLARHLQADREGSPDLAWWELHRALPLAAARLTAGSVLGVLSGLAVGIAIGPAVGTAAGLAVGLAVRALHPGVPYRWAPWSAGGRVRRLGAALLVGAAAGTAVGLAGGAPAGLVFGLAACLVLGLEARGLYPAEPSDGLRLSTDALGRRIVLGVVLGAVGTVASGPAAGVVLGVAGSLAGAFKGHRPDLDTLVGPAPLLAQDRRTFLAITAISGAVVALVVRVVVGLSVGMAGSAAFGLAFGLAAGFAETAAWVYFAAALFHLGLRRKVPWRLMAFLDDAHVHRGVLRQVGTVYQFRHLDLQRHLAQQRMYAGRYRSS